LIPVDMSENWKRMRFKGNKVWMAVDGEDRPQLENGRALIKYQLDQPHQYRVHPDNIHSLDDEPPETKTAARAPGKKSGAPVRKRPPASSHIEASADIPDALKQNAIFIYTDGACSGNPGPAGVGVVMCYKGQRKEISPTILRNSKPLKPGWKRSRIEACPWCCSRTAVIPWVY
jgi:ribonuclease HI